MANFYYYLMPSLPSLSLTMNDPPSFDKIWESSSELLSPQNKDLVKALWEETPISTKGLAQRWQNFKKELDLNLIKHRSQSLGRSLKENFIASSDFEVLRISQTVWQKDNPLEREIYLLEELFFLLDQWQPQNSFSFDSFIIYLLKLKLVNRIVLFKQEKGLASFDSIYNDLRDKILKNDRGV